MPPNPIYVGTRVFVAMVTYLVVLQIIRPLLDECPYGSCILPQMPTLTWGDPCAPKATAPCQADTCYSYEYANCPQVR